MTVNRKLYPPKTVWQAMRLERLQQVGYVCEECGVPDAIELRSEERRVGKECRSRWSPYH